ncbi:hypothetical protein M407DRAFT_32177 [Tulasnella calospora MUT 4182]|uniref:Glycoside hydrolase family 16 protein n=1 Tax=Tulasnella calospora MUT 4182 TaxID=1051891 RepID=A0A0C3Q4F8_9AGAM|nr:hypothetical protein M407DRAFT_32177 [Tulasnella calospora MUT 4182]
MYSPKYLAALALLFSSTVNAYTLQNVTVNSSDRDIVYFPQCSLRTEAACRTGAWFEVADSRFNGGKAMTCGDPTQAYGQVEPYFAYTFRGAAMYQWMNASTAAQLQLYDNNRNPLVDLVQTFPQFASSSDLVPVLAWSLEGLDPLQEHTVGIQHQAKLGGPETFLTFDYMVVTMTTLEPGDLPNKKKLSGGAIAGAVIAAVVGLGALIAGFFWFRGWANRRTASKSAKGGRWTWEGSFVKPSTVKFGDPSSEIEASERMAREGRMEEEQERKVGPLAV